ncbi:MAG: hypothetical protein LBI72_04785 [Flavobacteriaceae bacterium]|nr:hypothetical protein [Flavobacteriaceae bacterium]
MIPIIPFYSTITMTLLTINDYINSLRQHIEDVKLLSAYNTLLSPSPAQLKEHCLDLCNGNSLSLMDRDILRVFLKCESNTLQDVKAHLQKIDIDRFKPIQYFINGKTTMPKSQAVVEMIALLYNFELRPLGKFRSINLRIEQDVTHYKKSKEYFAVETAGVKNDLDGQIEELKQICNLVMSRQLKILSLLQEVMPKKNLCSFEDM